MIDLPPPSPTVETVIVQAPRLPDLDGDRAFSTARVSGDALQGATELDQALKTIPGFSLFRRTSTLGANPTTQGVSLRAIAGSGASRALVTLDGVPQNDPFGGWVIWTALSPQSIGGARVVRGAGSGPYGSGALTGVVQLDSAASVPGGAEIEASGGELGYRQGAAAVSADVAGTRILLNAAGQESDGWIPVREGRGPADRPLDLHAWTTSARVEHDVGAAVVAARVAGYEEDRGAGVVGAASRATGGQASLSMAQQPSANAPGYRLQGWVDWSDLYNATASIAARRANSTPANTQYATPAVGWGLNAAVRYAPQNSTLEIGADVRGAEGESRERFTYTAGTFTKNRVAGGNTLVAGLYLEASHAAGPWLVTGGVRMDEWAQYDGKRVESVISTGAVTLNNLPKDKDGLLPTARFGLRRDMGHRIAWRTATYAGFRQATLNELHRPFRVGNTVTESDPLLRPEKLYGIETGLDYERGRTKLAATVFYNQLDNAIANVTIGPGGKTYPIAGFIPVGGVLRMRENAGTVEAKGLEFDGRQQVWGDRVVLDGALAYTYSRVNGGGVLPQLTGKRPALTPRFTATAGARWQVAPKLDLGLHARYESTRYDDDLNTLKLRPALVCDLRADYAVRPNLTVFLAADNLFDAGVRTAEAADGTYSYDAPRLVRVGVRLSR